MKTLPTLYKKTAGDKTQVWTISVEEVQPGGHGKMITRYGLKGGKIQETEEIIVEGKNVGKKNETSAYRQAVNEALSRWHKQVDRKGYGLTVEASAVVRSTSPMLAHVYSKHSKKVDWGTAFAQPKLDGFRCLAHVTKTGGVALLSRENQPFTALTEIRDLLVAQADAVRAAGSDPRGVVLDGELYLHGMSLNEISSACKRRSDETKKIQYHVYDAMVKDAPFHQRYSFAEHFVRGAGSPLLVPVKTVKVRSEQELMVAQAEFISDGYEGAMLRHGNAPYHAGKRSDKLLKVKNFSDAEFVVVDFKLGRGKYAGVPVFVCETPGGNHFDVTAPGTMEEKQALGNRVSELIGKRLTVKYIYYTKTDSPVPFLPVAVRFREDD